MRKRTGAVRRRRAPLPADAAVERLVRIGMSSGEAQAKGVLFAEADAALTAAGAARRRWSIWSPGRLEVLGKHTDYAGGRSLVCAVEKGFCVRAAPREDRVVRVIDVVRAQSRELPLESDVHGDDDWTAYVAAVCRRMTRNFTVVTRGVDIAIGSDLPRAAGLSSSSALLVAVSSALAKANQLASSEEFRHVIFSREELAAYLGSVENGADFRGLTGDSGVGTLGGSQDHTAILCCEAGMLTQYAWSPVKREATIPVPKAHVFVIASSGVAAEKTGAARESYNRASLAVRRLLQQWNGLTSRNDATLGDALRSGEGALARLAHLARASTSLEFPAPYLSDRLQQFVAESTRILPAAAGALRTGELGAFGALVDWSQWATEQLLGNQVPETVHLARSARELGAVAASAFGAGFGGSVWALVPVRVAGAFMRKWKGAYGRAFPGPAEQAVFFATRAGPAAHQW